MNAKTAVGVEIVRSLKDEGTQTFAYCLTRLLNIGALIKGKAESSGLMSVLYEHQIEKGVKLALSGQFDARDFDKGQGLARFVGDQLGEAVVHWEGCLHLLTPGNAGWQMGPLWTHIRTCVDAQQWKVAD